MATDCFPEVQFPLQKHKILRSRKRAIIAVAVTTISLIVWCLPLLFTVDENCDARADFSKFVTVHYLLTNIVGFFASAAYILVINAVLVFRLAKPTDLCSVMHDAESMRETKVFTRIAILVSLTFVVCHSPELVVILLHTFRPGTLKGPNIAEWAFTASRLLSLIPRGINFGFYVGFSRGLRRSVKNFFRGQCLRCEDPPQPDIEMRHLPRRVTFRFRESPGE